MASLRPLNDKVIVRRVEAENQTAGGIFLPDQAKEKPKEGIIEAIGDGKYLESGERSCFQVGAGDRVLFSSYAGTEVKIDGEELIIMGEEDILAILG